MEASVLNVLACPCCGDKLFFNDSASILICKSDLVAFPVCDGLPVLLASEAVPWANQEEVM